MTMVSRCDGGSSNSSSTGGGGGDGDGGGGGGISGDMGVISFITICVHGGWCYQ